MIFVYYDIQILFERSNKMDLEIKPNNPTTTLNGLLILAMSVASGITVANIYYLQPLLAQMASYFQISQTQAGIMATLVQVGYASGLLLILPLADRIEKRRLICVMLSLSATFLLLFYLSSNRYFSSFIAFGIGFSSIIPQLLIPYGAQMAKPEERGRVIGSIMSGLLIGVLLSRVLSGILSSLFGWRSIFLLATCLMLILLLLLRNILPKSVIVSNITYIESLKSLKPLIFIHQELRVSAFIGAMAFCSFSAFWTSLTFLLQSSHYRMGPDVAGMFGIVGVVGAFFSPIAGKLTDTKGARYTVRLTILIIFVSFILFLFFGYHLSGLIVGVILLDLGVQCCNVSNQTNIHRLCEDARNRISSIYMVSFFLGGALGSYLGAHFYENFGWIGVCIFGLMTQIIALLVYFYSFHVCKNS